MSYKVNPKTEAYFITHAGHFKADATGIGTYEGLQAWRDANGIDAVYPSYQPTDKEVEESVFYTPQGVMAFQTWHDRRHLKFNKEFSLEDEHFLALQHVDELLRAGVSACDATVVYHLIYSRNAYYWNNGHRVFENPSDFVTEALREGADKAARDRRVEASPVDPDFLQSFT